MCVYPLNSEVERAAWCLMWTDSENIRENQLVREELLSSNRGCKQAFVGSGEELAATPESFLIYQGHTSERDGVWS